MRGFTPIMAQPRYQSRMVQPAYHSRMAQTTPPAPSPAPTPAPTPAPVASNAVSIPAGWPWYRSIWYEPAIVGIPLVPVLLGVGAVFAIGALAGKSKS